MRLPRNSSRPDDDPREPLPLPQTTDRPTAISAISASAAWLKPLRTKQLVANTNDKRETTSVYTHVTHAHSGTKTRTHTSHNMRTPVPMSAHAVSCEHFFFFFLFCHRFPTYTVARKEQGWKCVGSSIGIPAFTPFERGPCNTLHTHLSPYYYYSIAIRILLLALSLLFETRAPGTGHDIIYSTGFTVSRVRKNLIVRRDTSKIKIAKTTNTTKIKFISS